MLYHSLKNEIIKRYPSLKFPCDKEKKLISIPSEHEAIGSIDIQDDINEFTVFLGRFTHLHLGYYNADLASTDQLDETVSLVIEYLEDLFTDRIFIWATSNSGGSEYIDDEFQTNKDGFVWSGPYNS